MAHGGQEVGFGLAGLIGCQAGLFSCFLGSSELRRLKLPSVQLRNEGRGQSGKNRRARAPSHIMRSLVSRTGARTSSTDRLIPTISGYPLIFRKLAMRSVL